MFLNVHHKVLETWPRKQTVCIHTHEHFYFRKSRETQSTVSLTLGPRRQTAGATSSRRDREQRQNDPDYLTQPTGKEKTQSTFTPPVQFKPILEKPEEFLSHVVDTFLVFLFVCFVLFFFLHLGTHMAHGQFMFEPLPPVTNRYFFI